MLGLQRSQTFMQDTTPSPSYLYNPLDVEQAKEDKIIPIRLLLLHPIVSDDNNAIGQIVQRRKGQSYEALSYCWEAKSQSTEPSYIHILGDKGYSTLSIKPNLAAALRKLRKQGEIRPLWIDAVCIQQTNDAEKSEQIPLMSRIYQEADRVCIWLGEGEKDDEIALAHMRKIIELQGFESLIDSQYTTRWAALASLMKREWFSRRWVVQEIAYAREAHVYWGDQSIDWKDLADAVALFGSKADKIAELFRQDKQFSNRGDFLGDVEALGANRLVHTIGKVFRKADNGQRIETLLSLEALISNLSAFNSARPHDIIYAVLSLAQDARSSAVKPSDTFPQLREDYHIVPRLVEPQPSYARRPSLPRRPSGAAQNKRKHDTMADGETVVDNAQTETIEPPSSPLWPNAPMFNSMPNERDLAIEQMRADKFEDEAINAAFNRIETHLSCILGVFDYDTMVEKLKHKFPSVPVIGKKFWDEESWDWSRKSTKGAYALTLKLLHYERSLVQMTYSALRDRTKVKYFHVDYQKKFYEVCRDFINFTIRSSKSLDMLCRPWAPDNEELTEGDKGSKGETELPSWICPLSKSPFQPRPDGNFSRVNADLLVGMPDSAGRTYTASAATEPQNWFFGGKDKRNLFVTGLVLDEILECGTEALEGNIPHSWLKLGGWHDTNKDPPESFWRTIVADRNKRGQNPPSYYERACKYAFGQRTSRGSLNTDSLINNNNTSQVITDYTKRVQAVVWMRKLIRTKFGNEGPESAPPSSTVANGTLSNGKKRPEGGFLGLAPTTAQVGDKICLLRGCSVPVVLREEPQTRNEIRDSETEEQLVQMQTQSVGQKWEMLTCKLIGECYIHGIMDGEAFKIRVDRDLSDYIFEIQ